MDPPRWCVHRRDRTKSKFGVFERYNMWQRHTIRGILVLKWQRRTCHNRNQRQQTAQTKWSCKLSNHSKKRNSRKTNLNKHWPKPRLSGVQDNITSKAGCDSLQQRTSRKNNMWQRQHIILRRNGHQRISSDIFGQNERTVTNTICMESLAIWVFLNGRNIHAIVSNRKLLYSDESLVA